MKQIKFIIITVSLILGVTACTPDEVLEELPEPVACCGEDGSFPPPPPPPPPGGNN